MVLQCTTGLNSENEDVEDDKDDENNIEFSDGVSNEGIYFFVIDFI